MDFDLRDWKSIPIRQDNMSRFLGNRKEYFMFDCEQKANGGIHILNVKNYYYHILHEEIVQRAISKIDENKYTQVDKVLNLLI